MKAIRLYELGGPEVLKFEDVPMPEPGPGQARIKIEAIGVNFIDVYFRTGLYKAQLPSLIGREAAGVVDAVGPDVTYVHVGERVAYYADHNGSYAEYSTVPDWKLVPIPREISFDQAAATMVQGITAQYLATSTFPIQPGDVALVHAAGGGTGQMLVQIVKLRGGRVIGTASTAEKAQVARERGADDMIVYTEQDFEAEVRRFTGGRGVDVVYDSVGKETFDKSLNSLRPRGYMVLYGQSSGAVPPVDPQTLNAKGSLFLTRPFLGHYLATREELLRRANDVFEWIAEGKLKVTIARTFPLAEAAQAQIFLQSRQAKGKVLLHP